MRAATRERAFVDCLLTLDYSGGLEELDRSLPMFPSFDFESAFEYLKLLGRPWLNARLGFFLDRHRARLYFEPAYRAFLLRRRPKGVAYLGKKEPGLRFVSEWNLMVPRSLMEAKESA